MHFRRHKPSKFHHVSLQPYLLGRCWIHLSRGPAEVLQLLVDRLIRQCVTRTPADSGLNKEVPGSSAGQLAATGHPTWSNSLGDGHFSWFLIFFGASNGARVFLSPSLTLGRALNEELSPSRDHQPSTRTSSHHGPTSAPGGLFVGNASRSRSKRLR